MPWARLMRSGALTPVDVPQVDDAALRARTRARDETRADLKAATSRLNAFFLRHDRRETGRATWGAAHLRWLSAVVGPTPAQPIVLQASIRERGWHPTDASQVVATPRISAGSPVASDELRLCRWTKGKTIMKLYKSCSHLLTQVNQGKHVSSQAKPTLVVCEKSFRYGVTEAECLTQQVYGGR